MSRKNNCRAISDPRGDPSFRYKPGMEKFSESSGAPRPTCTQGQLQTMSQLSYHGCVQSRPPASHGARSEERNKPVRLPAMPIDVSALSDHLRGTVLDAGESDSWIAKALKPRKSSGWQSRAVLSSTALRRIPGILFHSSSLVIDQPRHRTGSSPALRVERRVPDLDAVVARLRSTATVSVANARDPTVPVDVAQSVQAHSAPT